MATSFLHRRRATEDQIPLGASRSEAIYLVLSVCVLAAIAVAFWFTATH
jgi:hypothetical protein